jgi:tetratricopeptide (TPR) repeat protein
LPKERGGYNALEVLPRTSFDICYDQDDGVDLGACGVTRFDIAPPFKGKPTAVNASSWPAPDRMAFQAAERALASGDTFSAERAALTLAQRYPASAPLHRLIATARRRRGDLSGAATAYRSAEALAPNDPDLLVDHAGLLDRMGVHEQAIDRYRRVLALTPSHRFALLGLALALKHAGKPDAALETVAQGLRQWPRDHGFWQTQGALLRDLGESDLAAQAFDQVLKIAPRDVGGLRGRARVETESGRPALAFYERALRQLPDDRELLLGLAVARAVEGRAREGIAALDALVQHRPDWTEGYVALARLRWQYEGAERFDEGFRTALARAPRNGPLWATWLRALSRAGRHDRVTALVGEARAVLGPSATLDMIEAQSASETGDMARADGLFAQLASADGGAALLRLAHLLRAGRPDQAAALAEGMMDGPAAAMIAPYLDTAWRMMGDSRTEWLLGRPDLTGTAMLDVDLEALGGQLRDLHSAARAPLDQSLRFGTQTEGPLLSRSEPIIRRLRDAVLAATERYVGALPPVDPGHPFLAHRADRLLVTGSWSVRLTGHGFHVAHVHSAGWVSSAFYVALPDAERGAGKDEHAGWLVLGEPPAGMAEGIGPRRMVEPRAGLLVLFPSMMWHGTRPFATGERLTAAFDMVPRS